MKLLIAVAVILVIGVLIYNTLVSRRNQCDNIFAASTRCSKNATTSSPTS